MRDVKVLGSGCSKCQATADLIRQVAEQKGVDVTIEKVTDMAKIVSYGVMSTPGVVIDGKVVHAGSLPVREKITEWLV